MGKRSYLYAVVTLAWTFFGIFLSNRLFGDDRLAEVATVVCAASTGVAISIGIEFFLSRLKDRK